MSGLYLRFSFIPWGRDGTTGAAPNMGGGGAPGAPGGRGAPGGGGGGGGPCGGICFFIWNYNLSQFII